MKEYKQIEIPEEIKEAYSNLFPCEDCEGSGIVEKTGIEPDDITEVKCHCHGFRIIKI